MEKCIIVAIADNNAIGKNNSLLWHISEDLKFFKHTTTGCPVRMTEKLCSVRMTEKLCSVGMTKRLCKLGMGEKLCLVGMRKALFLVGMREEVIAHAGENDC